MRPSKAHFVTSCQQLLALAAVLAVLTPAAAVVSLDVVQRVPGSVSAGQPRSVDGEAPASGRVDRSGRPDRSEPGRATVPVGRVAPTVTEVPLTPPGPRPGTDGGEPDPRAGDPRARQQRRQPSAPGPSAGSTEQTTIVSEPERVVGYGAVGITWASGERIDDEDIRLEVRTATAGEWTEWTGLEYHDEHGPEVASPEAGQARPGTDPLLVGRVDEVQARVVADAALPADLSLAVVAPGRAATVAEQPPELAPGAGEGEAAVEGPASSGEDGLALSAAGTSAPRPRIYSRKQWGADERMRDGRPRYGTIKAGFVHHTVNANNYRRRDVPGILRSIYAYHTRSRGWSDIGYNFLVDKFGRIWEGRAGGVRRPVVGAHTLGYNEESFAMSAIGNYETARPPKAMLRAYGALFAWKLGRHGIDPLDRSQRVNGTRFAAINGHRDAGSTACPGRYLYAKLPTIRQYAAEAGAAPEGPEPVRLGQVDSDLAGNRFPDLAVRRASDGRGLVLPTGGLTRFRRGSVVAPGWGGRTTLAVPDVSGDGRIDVVTFDRSGALQIRPRLAGGGSARVARTVRRFRGHDVVAAAGDVNGNDRPDFVARAKGRLVTFLGTRRGGFHRVVRDTSMRGYRQVVGAGDVTGDGQPDLWAQNHRSQVFLHRGLGRGRFTNRQLVDGDWTGYDWLVGGVDYSGDGVPDLIARREGGALVLLPSVGDGRLGRAVGPVRGAGLSMISGAGQLGGSKAPDLLATRADGALVLVGNRGTFHLGAPVDTGRSFRRGNLLINAGDFTGDGHGDVIMRRRIGSLWLYRGDGTGRLSTPTWIGGKRPFRAVTDLRVTVDVTGDGAPDLVGRHTDGDTRVWPGRGKQRLGKPEVVELASEGTTVARAGYDWTVAVSDLRRRGSADVLARDHEGHLYRLDGGKSGFAPPYYLGEAAGYDLAG